MKTVEYTDENGMQIGVVTHCAGYLDSDALSVYFQDRDGNWQQVFSNPCYVSADCDPSDDMLREWAEEILADSEEYSAALAGTL